MAKVTRVIRYCDVCGSENGRTTITVRITGALGATEADLCDEHAEPVRAIVASRRRGSGRTAASKERHRGRKAAGASVAASD